jgi:hypothetical protein
MSLPMLLGLTSPRRLTFHRQESLMLEDRVELQHGY